MIIFFLKKQAANISQREERQNLNITKYEFIKKSVEIFLTYSFGTKKKFSSALQLAGETCEINFEQQTKTQIFYFQELWRYVVLFLRGEIMGRGQMASKRIHGSNWLKIAILFITILCCFQANKIKVS